MKKVLAGAAIATLLAGCMTLSAGPVEVAKLGQIVPGPREVTIVNETPYTSEMAVALDKANVQLKPAPSVGSVATTQNATTTTQRIYSTKYGIDLRIVPTRQFCAFTDHYIVNAKLTVIDLETNKPVAVLTQRGADGPCTSVEPVFDSLGKAVGDLWSK